MCTVRIVFDQGVETSEYAGCGLTPDYYFDLRGAQN
jgi:hypothetical protein